MQVEPLVFSPVKFVPDNGAIQSERVGCMYPQLVCPAGLGIEIHAGAVVGGVDGFVAGNGFFAMLEIDSLAGAVVRVKAKGEVDGSFRLCGNAFQPGGITLLDGVLPEHFLKLPVNGKGFGDEQQPGGCHVQAVDDVAARESLLCPLGDGYLSGFAGYAQHAGGFVENGNPRVLPDNFQRESPLGGSMQQWIVFYL